MIFPLSRWSIGPMVHRSGTPGTSQGKKGDVEPDWSRISADSGFPCILDNNILWMKWGTAGIIDSEGNNRVEVLGRRQKTMSSPEVVISAFSTESIRNRMRGIVTTDAITVSPATDIQPGLIWNALIPENDVALIRLTNSTNAPITCESITWHVNCWKS